MRPDEVRGLGKLAGRALGGGTRRISELHSAISQRVFGNVARGVGPVVTPVPVIHDGIAGAVYAGVSTALDVGAQAAGLIAAQRARDDGSLADHPNGRVMLAVLNGAHGDLLQRELAALALPMTLRHQGVDLLAEPEALRAAYPNATPRLAVFLHGLLETEDAWRYRAARHYGDPTITYGSLLERDLGYTPVWVRYNTGLHISANGRQLAALLDRLVGAWPVPVEDLVLIGHSMGGLVARSALAQAGDGTPVGQPRWPGLVRDTVTLGSPHLGAPLEQGTNILTHLLARLGETRWLAHQLAGRSVGIKDLRYGNPVEADWAGHDPDTLANYRTHVPLRAGTRHFVVLATVTGTADSLLGGLVGDLLVRPNSACGDSGDDQRMAVPDEHVCRLSGLNHFDLLNHPQVYAQIYRWLANRPEEDRSSSAPFCA